MYVVEAVPNVCEVFVFGAGAVVGWRGGTGSIVAVAVEGVHKLVPCAIGVAQGRAVKGEGSEGVLCW